MLAVLLVLGLFIVLMQLGLMALLRRLSQQLERERARVDALERALRRADVERRLAPTRDAAPAAAAPAVAATTPAAAGTVRQAAADPAAPATEPAQLRGEMLGLMRQLVEQGLSVRDIASRCGLSEAEAELMLSLQAGAAHA